MPICKKCEEIFKKTGTGRGTEKLCPKCWFVCKRGNKANVKK